MKRKTPTVIEISAVDGYCTKNCAFCPVVQLRDKHYADCQLLSSVFHDLSLWHEVLEKHVKLDLTPFGEFLAHRYWREILHDANSQLSELAIYLHTNANLMGMDDFAFAINHLNTLIIDLYDYESYAVKIMNDHDTMIDMSEAIGVEFWYSKNDGCVNILNGKKVSNVYSSLIKHNKKNVVFLDNTDSYMNKNVIHTAHNWGIFSTDIFKFKDISCVLPMRQLVIDSYGNMVLCCEDIARRHIFGNISEKDSVAEYSYYKDVWLNNEYLNKIRQILRHGGDLGLLKRAHIDLCSRCTSRVGARRVGIEEIDKVNFDIAEFQRSYSVFRSKFMNDNQLDMENIRRKEALLREMIKDKDDIK